MSRDAAAAKVVRWVKRRLPDGAVLNVAGSRRSKAPGIHMAVKRVIREVLDRLADGDLLRSSSGRRTRPKPHAASGRRA